jgi:hypothetical protein
LQFLKGAVAFCCRAFFIFCEVIFRPEGVIYPMKLWIILAIGMSALIGCEKEGSYQKETTGAGGAGPGYDGTGSGPGATNVNEEKNSQSDE